MPVLSPSRLDQALAALADDPSLVVLSGGTDLMVQANYGRRRPDNVLSLRHLPDLRRWYVDGQHLVIGAATTFTDLLVPRIAEVAPALAQAARTVGSPQIRNAGTLGGNLVTASPAGDALPVLVAADATVQVASRGRWRTLPVSSFITGPKQTVLEPDELVVSVRVPVASGPQEFLKVGVRNAMVIAVTSCAVVVDQPARLIRCALGSVGPTPVRSAVDEHWLAEHVEWTPSLHVPAAAAETFGRRMARAAQPIDDHRATADYRRHAVGVLVQRALTRLG